MNIFAVSDSAAVCAAWLDNRRLNKMILETAQLLTTYVVETLGFTDERLYKVTHKNHPAQKWLQEDKINVSWLVDLFFAYCEEYEARTGKVHKCEKYYDDVLLVFICRKIRCLVALSTPKSFPNITPYKELDDVHLAYRLTLADKWKEDIQNGRPPKFN